MEFETGKDYPLSEIDDAGKWWELNRQYNINEFIDHFTVTLRDEDDYRQEQIIEIKKMLLVTDYQAIKYAEGLLTAEEYAPVKSQRQAWRNEINRLESLIDEPIE